MWKSRFSWRADSPHGSFGLLGAAGNFLTPISALSENGFRTVIEIDTVGTITEFDNCFSHSLSLAGYIPHNQGYYSLCQGIEGLLYSRQCDSTLPRYIVTT